MTGDLSDQVVVVVGGTRGIGAAIATDLAAAGATVFVAGRDLDAARGVVGAIETAGGTAHGVACDVTDADDCRRMIDTVAETSGRLDTMFANQGVARRSRNLVEWSPADVAICLDVNLVGCVTLARAAHRLLAADGGGRFIVTGSGSGHRNVAGLGMYGISKAAVSHLVRQLAIEWRRDDIAVNELIPGPVRTAMTGFRGDGDGDRADNPMQVFADRMGEWLKEPADVAPLARFLAGLPTHGPTGQVFSLAGRV